MSCDAINYNTFDPKPAFFASVQVIESQFPSKEGYKIDWRELLRMNIPSKAITISVASKQILAGKVATTASLDEEFSTLLKQWKDETFFHSSLTKIFNHPAYVRIMAMGTAGLPFVLKELQQNQGRWFYALKFMAGKDVAAGIKNSEDARAAWLEWGYKNNYI